MAAYLLSEASAEGLQRLLKSQKTAANKPVGQTRFDKGESLDLPERISHWRVERFNSLNAFAIYLGGHPLNIGGSEISVGGVSTPSGILGEIGWRTIDGFSGGDIWLVISNASDTPTATISSNQGSSGTTSVHIATATIGDDGAVDITQSLVGELVIGGGGDGGGGITGSYTVVTGSEYTSSYKMINHRVQMVFANGLLTGVNALTDEEVFTTTPHSTSMD